MLTVSRGEPENAAATFGTLAIKKFAYACNAVTSTINNIAHYRPLCCNWNKHVLLVEIRRWMYVTWRLRKLCHIVFVTLTIQRPYMATQETLSHCFRDTDHLTTIYGDSGKLRHIVFVTLTIQQPYMAIQENFVPLFL